ncbi:transposase [bacterium]|nr:transposase [bacterium]
MLSGQGSRNQLNENLFNEETKTILENIFGLKLPSIPHGDTLAHLWKKLPPEAMEKLRLAMIQRLLRSRCLEKFRYGKRYILTLDGTEIYRWKKRHCKHCLYSACGPNKEIQYYHRVLEVKLVSEDGFAISLLSEFIENDTQPADKPDDKQDCELKAAYRLLERLKKNFPQLKLILLGDGLYPKGPVFRLCEDAGWKYIFVLQDKVLPTVWEDFESLLHMPLNALGVKDKDPIKTIGNKVYRWVNQLSYQGEKFDGLVNILDILKPDENGKLKRFRGYITNLVVNEYKLEAFEKLAQQRWKVENQGFDVQKNHGYALEHVWCQNSNAMKVVYLLIQIAHLLNQLIVRSDLLNLGLRKLSLKSFFRLFQQALTQCWTQEIQAQWKELRKRRFQWRDSS